MPEMTFTVEWPDGQRQDCYSPSLVVHDHLEADQTYSVTEFVDRSRTALNIASDRVLATYGMRCTSAMATLAAIERRASTIHDPAQSRVHVVALQPPLPARPVHAPRPDTETHPDTENHPAGASR